MIFFRRIRYATEMTIKTYMQSDKDLFKKGNTPKDYLELFIEFYINRICLYYGVINSENSEKKDFTK